jgi:hypothetical protein
MNVTEGLGIDVAIMECPGRTPDAPMISLWKSKSALR